MNPGIMRNTFSFVLFDCGVEIMIRLNCLCGRPAMAKRRECVMVTLAASVGEGVLSVLRERK